MGKLTPAQRAGAPTVNERLKGFGRFKLPDIRPPLGGSIKYPRAVIGPPAVAIGISDSPTAHRRWEPLHGGQGSISLEYQTYTSAHPFDTLVTGLAGGSGLAFAGRRVAPPPSPTHLKLSLFQPNLGLRACDEEG